MLCSKAISGKKESEAKQISEFLLFWASTAKRYHERWHERVLSGISVPVSLFLHLPPICEQVMYWVLRTQRRVRKSPALLCRDALYIMNGWFVYAVTQFGKCEDRDIHASFTLSATALDWLLEVRHHIRHQWPKSSPCLWIVGRRCSDSKYTITK